MPRPEAIVFAAGDVELAGTHLLPDAPPPAERDGRYPTVLLLASWLPRDRDGAYDRVGHPGWFSPPATDERLLARLAAALAERGIASLRYDKRGAGRSGGRWETSDLFGLVDDARDALGALRGRPQTDLRRTGVIGHGEGAALALILAAGDPALSALTLIGPAARGFRDVLRRAVAARARSGGGPHPVIRALDRVSEELIERADRAEPSLRLRGRGFDVVELDLRAWEQAFRTPPFALATMLTQPSVALVHGAEDGWTAPDESRLLADALRRSGATASVRVLPGNDHELSQAADEVIDEIASDLAARLAPRDLPPVLLAIEGAG